MPRQLAPRRSPAVLCAPQVARANPSAPGHPGSGVALFSRSSRFGLTGGTWERYHTRSYQSLPFGAARVNTAWIFPAIREGRSWCWSATIVCRVTTVLLVLLRREGGCRSRVSRRASAQDDFPGPAPVAGRQRGPIRRGQPYGRSSSPKPHIRQAEAPDSVSAARLSACLDPPPPPKSPDRRKTAELRTRTGGPFRRYEGEAREGAGIVEASENLRLHVLPEHVEPLLGSSYCRAI